MLLVKHRDKVTRLRLVQGDPLLIELPLLYLNQVSAPETGINVALLLHLGLFKMHLHMYVACARLTGWAVK